MNWFNAIVALGLALILLPAFVAGGWMIALVFAVGWLLLTVGGREGLDLLKQRQSGATAAKYQRKSRSFWDDRKDDGRRWKR